MHGLLVGKSAAATDRPATSATCWLADTPPPQTAPQRNYAQLLLLLATDRPRRHRPPRNERGLLIGKGAAATDRPATQPLLLLATDRPATQLLLLLAADRPRRHRAPRNERARGLLIGKSAAATDRPATSATC